MSEVERYRYDFVKRVDADLQQERIWVKAWSFVHHSFLFGTAILSAAAAFVLEIKWAPEGLTATQLGKLLAAAAALAGTIASAGGFSRKWRTNRLTLSRLDQLKIDLGDPACDLDAARTTLKKIWSEHDQGIVGADAS